MMRLGHANCGSCHPVARAGVQSAPRDAAGSDTSKSVIESLRARLILDNMALPAAGKVATGTASSESAISRVAVLAGSGLEQRITRSTQSHAGSIVGVLYSSQRAALGGSRIALSSAPASANGVAHPAEHNALETIANGDGWFGIRGVPAGAYTLHASFDGYDSLTMKSIVVKPGDALALELVLKPLATPSRSALLPRLVSDNATAVPPPPEPGPAIALIRRTEVEVTTQRDQEPVGEESQVFTPSANRWKYRYPAFRRYSTSGDFQYVRGHWYDPFNSNRLKGDFPILGNRTFLTLNLVSDTFNDGRQLPLPPLPSRNLSSFGITQYAMSQNFNLSAELSGGDGAFRPVDWRIRMTPTINLNYTAVGAPGLLNYVKPETTRFDTQAAGLQEAFAEVKLKDLSNAYDFVSVRAGIQAFNSDFRGFIFSDREPGVRLFGTLGSNRYQYNIAGFATLVKNANSGLNTLVYRNQLVYIANLYRQDFPWHGYTIEFSFHYDKDDPSAAVNGDNFQVRPVPIGPSVLHAVRAYYYGFAGDGHIGRLNVSHAFYEALGHDTYSALALRPVKINAQMGALELSLDHDWIRYRTSFLYASGSRKVHSGTANGFDAILENPNFAGGLFSFWNREAIDISGRGVGLVAAGSLIPDLRSGRTSGQANFVNPGIFLYNAGADVDITPKLRGFANLNLLRFAATEPLEVLLNRTNLHAGIGADAGIGLRYRPALTDNVVFTVGFNTLFPFAGFRQIYFSGPFFGLFTSVQFRY